MRFYVIDGDENFISFDDDGEKAQFFKTEKAALKRATEFAKINPNTKYYVAKVISETYVPKTDPVTEILF